MRNPPATFFVRNKSEDIANISLGDLLIVDRSIQAESKMVVIALVNGKMMLRRLLSHQNKWLLESDKEGTASIVLEKDLDWEIWGVVRHVIHSF